MPGIINSILVSCESPRTPCPPLRNNVVNVVPVRDQECVQMVALWKAGEDETVTGKRVPE